jgi:hypothetical protein
MRRRLSTPSPRYCLQRLATDRIQASTLRTAAISGAIDQSTSHRRHQHPDRGLLARRPELALALRSEHRQHSIPIGRDPRSAASFNQASVQSRGLQRSIHRALDAGSRRTLNHSDEVAH